MNKFKKVLTTLLITVMLVGRITLPVMVLAEDAPSAPSAPDTPSAPSAPEAPETGQQAPIVLPSEPVFTEDVQSGQAEVTETQPSEGVSSSGNVGDTTIGTGNAENGTTVVTTGNNNTSASPVVGPSGASVVNSGNGAGSTNAGSASTVNSGDTSQNNSANVNNDIVKSSTTGGNNASMNVGDSTIVTGDANTTGTVITAVNTNVSGVMVSEFNVVDDLVGDIILDFVTNCVSGCAGSSVNAQNIGNGADSFNNADASVTSGSTTTQANDAGVGNSLTLAANSGYNDTNFNTGGDSIIVTGDANVSGNVLTFANNNIAGNVVYGVVNIFGDLVGDIILTEAMMNALCGGSCAATANATNTGNGADSTNTASSSSNAQNTTSQDNNADITNTLVLDGQTGNNSTSFNTGGDSGVQTGDVNITANVLNIANLNLIGGNYWLVLVNEAGNWIGKILGAPSGSTVAATPLLDIIVNPQTGSVTATNSGNGAGSDNSADASSQTNSTTTQTNNAKINNELNLSANTGENSSSFNTGGNSNIITGDANIVANIVNFVNNNIVGNGKLFVTVVNVFGSWLGDFVTPGTAQAEEGENTNDDSGIGGAPEINPPAPSAPGSSSGSGSSSSSSSSSSSQSPSPSSSQSVFASAATRVARYSYSSTGQIASGEEDSKVASADPLNANVVDEDGGLDINLAWGLLLIPLYFVIRIARGRLSA